MSRKNPWADPKSRAAILRGIRLAARKQRKKKVSRETRKPAGRPLMRFEG